MARPGAKCVPCGGTGQSTVEVTDGDTGAVTHFQMECFACEGKGRLSARRAAALKAEAAVWCRCGDVGNDDVVFYDDGQHPEIGKHHYRHGACGKVVQIG